MEIDLVLKYGYPIRDLVRNLQQKVSEEIERLTALNIKQFNATVKSLVVEKKKHSEGNDALACQLTGLILSAQCLPWLWPAQLSESNRVMLVVVSAQCLS